jgi:hypothetical protein
MLKFGYGLSAPRRELVDIQNEISHMSTEEQQRLHDDVYGCSDDNTQYNSSNNVNADLMIDDSPTEQQHQQCDVNGFTYAEKECLDKMANELQYLIRSRHEENSLQYFRRVHEIAPEFATNQTLMLQFLRCEDFNIQVCHHWQIFITIQSYHHCGLN